MLKEIEIARANFGERHLKTAVAYNNLGVVERRMGDTAAALENFGRAVQMYRELDVPADRQVANLYLNIGNTYQDVGDFDRAADYFERGLALENLAERDPRNYAYFLNNYGNLLDLRGDVDRGRKMLRDAITVKTEVFGATNVSTARSMLYLAESQIRSEDEGDAADLIDRARAAFEENYSAGDRKMSFLKLVEAKLARRRGDLDSAMAGLQATLALRLEEYDERHRETVVVLCELARTAAMADDLRTARRWLDQAAPGIAELASTSTEFVEARIVTAEVLAAEGRDREAVAVASEVAAVVRRHYPARSDWTGRIDALGIT